MNYNPKEDGQTHINVYSQGLTELGRLLSNFAETPFTHPRHGQFKSVEGFIYWLGSNNEELRNLSGIQAKNFGQIADVGIRLRDHEFKKSIREALRMKVTYNPKIRTMLLTSDLPLAHYYIFNRKVVTVPKWDWVIQEWENIRVDLKAGKL